MKACSIPGCDKAARGRGWCNAHWLRWRRNGDATSIKREQWPSLEERFWMKVLGDVETGCCLWQASVDRKGYGQIAVLLADGRKTMKKAHHVALELAGRTVPRGLCGLHRCDTPACVREDHLFIGTVADNQSDMKAKGRWANQFVKGPAYAS